VIKLIKYFPLIVKSYVKHFTFKNLAKNFTKIHSGPPPIWWLVACVDGSVVKAVISKTGFATSIVGSSCQVAKDGNSTVGNCPFDSRCRLSSRQSCYFGDQTLATNASSLVVGFVGLVAKMVVQSPKISVAELLILVVCA